MEHGGKKRKQWLRYGAFCFLCGMLLRCHAVQAAAGVGNALMNVPSAGALSPGAIEFSPTWTTSFINHQFGPEGERIARENLAYLNQLELRLTFGLPCQWEVGFALQGSWRFDTKHTFYMEKFSVGVRRDLVRVEKRWTLALFGGLKLPVSIANPTMIADVGVVQSYTPYPWLQIDASVGFLIESQINAPGLRYDVGIGAFVIPKKLQLLVEWTHEWSWGPVLLSKGSLGAGINWNLTPAITLTFGAIFDVLGYNVEQGYIAYFSYAHLWEISGPKT